MIALTKRDAVSIERLEQARDETRRLIENTFLETGAVIAVSARTGEGLSDLKEALFQVALSIPEHSTDAVLHLPLDRAFSIPGFGTVVTGTLHDGSIRQGDGVELQPGGRAVRVRGIQMHHKSVKEAHAPTRVALNLAGIEVGDVVRGDTIVQPGTLTPAMTVDVELTVLEGARPLKHRSQLGLHAFTSESHARLLLYDPPDEEEKRTRLARLRLSRPVLLAPGDHFVLRKHSPAEIISGGRVLDAHPMPRWRKSAVRQWLMQIRDAPPEQQIMARVQRRGAQGISLAALEQETGLQKNAIRGLTAPLIAANRVIADNERYLHPEALNDAVDFLFQEVTRKDSDSIARAELLSKTGLQDWVFDLAVKQLVQTKPIRMVGTQLSRKEIGSAAAQQAEILAKVEEIYRAAGLGSPLVSEVASSLHVPQRDLPPLITLLVRSGKLVRMGADKMLIHRDALAKLQVELIKQRGQTFDVGSFKAFTGLTRKHAIPLLEYLDRSRVTVNNQGVRKVL